MNESITKLAQEEKEKYVGIINEYLKNKGSIKPIMIDNIPFYPVGENYVNYSKAKLSKHPLGVFTVINNDKINTQPREFAKIAFILKNSKRLLLEMKLKKNFNFEKGLIEIQYGKSIPQSMNEIHEYGWHLCDYQKFKLHNTEGPALLVFFNGELAGYEYSISGLDPYHVQRLIDLKTGSLNSAKEKLGKLENDIQVVSAEIQKYEQDISRLEANTEKDRVVYNRDAQTIVLNSAQYVKQLELNGIVSNRCFYTI